MATTIQLEESTVEELRRLKASLRVSTYDEVLRSLLTTHRKRTMPIRGATPYVGPHERESNDRD